jgi:diphthine synthase
VKGVKSKLFFIGMGLSGLKSCSLETLDLLKEADLIFIEKYTNFVLDEIPELFKQVEHKFMIVTREDLEDRDQEFLEKIENKFSALLVPGDPFIATTHNSLRLAAIEKGFNCRIIHNTSIISAAASASGLSSYRFGRTVTCPFPDNASEFPYEIIRRNKQIEAHTLVLLDINLPTRDFLSVNDAIEILLELEKKKQEKLISHSLVIGLAQIGYEGEVIIVGSLEEVKTISWSDLDPPQALIVCADSLQEYEEETLQVLWRDAK